MYGPLFLSSPPEPGDTTVSMYDPFAQTCQWPLRSSIKKKATRDDVLQYLKDTRIRIDMLIKKSRAITHFLLSERIP